MKWRDLSGMMPRYRISHGAFSILFPAALFVACNAVNIDKLSRWFIVGGRTDHFSLMAYLLAALSLLIAFFVLFAHRWTIKPAAILISICSMGATYFIAKYDVAIDTSMMLNVVHTDATEVHQLLSVQMFPYVIFLALVPIVATFCADVQFRPSAWYLMDSMKIFAIAIVIAVASLYLNYTSVIRAGNVSRKYIIYSLVPVNVISGGINAAYQAAKPWVEWGGNDVDISGRVASSDSLVVVLAIGESSRRSNFSVYGYERRETNPILGKIAGLQLLDGVARKGSTLNALPEILEKSELKLPAITWKLGIPTTCYVNYTLYDNCEPVAEVKVVDCSHGGRCYDEDVIPLLERNLATYSSGKRLIVLHLGGGSHGPIYSDRYPSEYQRFRPMCTDADLANECTLEQIYNSYDNSILYVDHVLGGILDTLDGSGAPYVFIYLSDHGESLMEGGRMFHGMPPGMTLPPEQAEIPLIVKASVPISIATRGEYSQPDVFDTVLDLLSIDSPSFDLDGSFVRVRAGPVAEITPR
jgi:lipid A ethanolaminephosphotransferase